MLIPVLYTYIRTYVYYFLVTTINFEKPAYSIDEYDGAIHPVLILSNPVSKDVTVKVLNTDGSADGENFSYKYIIM